MFPSFCSVPIERNSLITNYTAIELAAAKRSARSRARSRGAPSDDANGVTPETPNASFTLPGGSSTNSADKERREQLLRRLNEISQQRSRLVRRVNRDDVREGKPNRSTSNGESEPRPRTETLTANGRRRGLSNGITKPSREMREARDVARRNGRHHPHKRVEAVVHEPVREVDPSKVPALDLKLAPRNSPQATPPTTPALGTRGSARVRTPSVLLQSQPGEVIPPLKPNPVVKNRQAAYCLKLIKDFLRLKDGFAFSKPITEIWSADQLPGYFDMIKTPMDLDTVRKRLESGHYMDGPVVSDIEDGTFDVSSFSKDVRLIFENARSYNRPGDVFYEAATRLLDKFNTKISKLPSLEELNRQAARKNVTKKRKKNQSKDGGESSKKAESSKRRKAVDADGQPVARSRPPKKKPATASRTKTKPQGQSSSKKKPATKPKPVVVKDIKTMGAEELEARLRALERQRALKEPGSPAASPAANQSYYAAEAQALYNVEISREELIELSENVTKLPAEKINKIISLASKSSNDAMEVTVDEEIVLDFGSLPNKTLRDIQGLMRQTLAKSKKGLVDIGPNGDVLQLNHSQVLAEIEKIKALQRRRSRERDGIDAETTTVKKKSFYDGDSDSSSDSEGSDGSESDDEGSSSDESESSEDSEGDYMRKNRERNLAHHQAMQAAGTPLSSPPVRGGAG